MNRFYRLWAGVFSMGLVIACDDEAANAQQSAQKARADEAATIGEVRAEANQDIRNARAEADQKIASADAKFATLREDYRHDMAIKMVDMDKKVADLEASAVKANGSAKAGIVARLDGIHAQHTTFMNHYEALDKETASTWDATRVRLDAEWAELVARVDAA